ncbi:collagen alpha-1(I) chain-like [Mus pahari]|uniref:collagen alpha-1(I) chain-like n=1 Tax=Mus pahari TaxID=10093 RepID=UPI000A30F909|nr:collagen alpha-1(I) chain-like [Mus pahari]
MRQRDRKGCCQQNALAPASQTRDSTLGRQPEPGQSPSPPRGETGSRQFVSTGGVAGQSPRPATEGTPTSRAGTGPGCPLPARTGVQRLVGSREDVSATASRAAGHSEDCGRVTCPGPAPLGARAPQRVTVGAGRNWEGRVRGLSHLAADSGSLGLPSTPDLSPKLWTFSPTVYLTPLHQSPDPPQSSPLSAEATGREPRAPFAPARPARGAEATPQRWAWVSRNAGPTVWEWPVAPGRGLGEPPQQARPPTGGAPSAVGLFSEVLSPVRDVCFLAEVSMGWGVPGEPPSGTIARSQCYASSRKAAGVENGFS